MRDRIKAEMEGRREWRTWREEGNTREGKLDGRRAVEEGKVSGGMQGREKDKWERMTEG